MSYRYFNRYLSNNEEVLEIFHSAVFFLILQITLRFFIFLCAFFFMVPIMKLGIMGLLLFLAIVSFCIISTYVVYKKWEYDCLVVTNKKSIRCYWGLVKNDMEEFFLDNIFKIDIEYRNFFCRVLKIGDMIIILKNKKQVYFELVFNPKNVKNFILEVRV
jgi:hypothetical protein